MSVSAVSVPGLNFPPKMTAEAPFESSQISAYIAGPIASSFDKQVFRLLARNYIFEGASPVHMCERNSMVRYNLFHCIGLTPMFLKVAAEVGDWNAVQVWDKLRGLLSEALPLPLPASQSPSRSLSSSRNSFGSVSDNAEGRRNSLGPLRNRVGSRSPSAEQASTHTSRGKLHRRHRRRVSSLSKSSTPSSVTQSLSRSGSRNVSRHPDRHTSSLSPNTVRSRKSGSTTPSHVSVANSNHQKSPSITSLHSQHSSSSRRPGIPPSLAMTASSRTRAHRSPNLERRKPTSEARDNGLGRLVTDARNRSDSFGSAAALLALGEDDTGSGERSDDEDDDLDDSDVSLDELSPRHIVPLSSLREARGGNASASTPTITSMNIKSLPSQRPSLSDPSDIGALADDNRDSSSPTDGPHQPPSRSLFNKSIHAPGLNPHGGKIILPVRAIDHYLNTRKVDEDKQGIPRVFSEMSVKTAVPSKQSHLHSLFMSSQRQEVASGNASLSSGAQATHHLDSNKFQSSLTVKAHDDKAFQKRSRGRSRSFRRGNKISDISRKEIKAAHQRILEIGWQSLRERIEREIECGNIQLAAAVCIIGGENIFTDRQRVEDLCTTYVGKHDWS